MKNKRDLLGGLVFVATGTAFAIGSRSYSLGTSVEPGPGYFPFGLGILLALVGLFELAKAAVNHAGEDQEIGAVAWRPLLVIVGAVTFFGLALPYLGLLIALPILVVITALAADTFSLKEVAISAAVLTVGCWALFIYMLDLTIPLGPTLGN